MARANLYTTKQHKRVLSVINTANTPKGYYDTDITINTAITVLQNQLEVEGVRKRTAIDYIKWFERFTEFTGVYHLSELSADHIYSWLESMDVSNSSKLIRLKSLKAVLGRFYDRGYFRTRFWASIKIRVDSKVKQPATPEALNLLLSLLDLTNYFQLRDAVAILLMYRTGIRITTLCKLEDRHIDFNGRLLRLSGDITKNRQTLSLPLDNELLSLIRALMAESERIRQFKGVQNTFLFVSKDGQGLQQVVKSNVIQKRLYKYATVYGLPNISPHAIRRAFARNLYDKGATLPVISKALGHQDFEVTAKYLNISNEELIDSLRKLQDKS